jgi:DNA-binding transcriptional LysR family regulator
VLEQFFQQALAYVFLQRQILIAAFHPGRTGPVSKVMEIGVEPLAARAAVCAGAMLFGPPDCKFASDLAAGRLIQVLPQWRLPSGGIHAVSPAARFRPAKVCAFVELLADRGQKRQATNG